MTDSIEARVARGAALLDKHEPDWWRQVDLGTLDLSNGCRCVLGQLYTTNVEQESLYGPVTVAISTGYDVGKDLLGLDWETSRAHGFAASFGDPLSELAQYRALDEAWIAVIKDRWERLA